MAMKRTGLRPPLIARYVSRTVKGQVVDTNQKNRWTIKRWNRELARGVITCPQLGDVLFDGSVAMVADFRLGEVVEVKLDGQAPNLQVSRIWPDDPRFAPRENVPSSAPSLAPEVVSRVASALALIPDLLDFRVISLEGDLVVRGDDNCFAYGHLVEVRFRSVEYVELPMGWDGKSFGLANDVERSYLASRSEVSPSTVAVRIVDAARQIFFVTCADVETVRKSG